jgi:signal transduction histidine kinase
VFAENFLLDEMLREACDSIRPQAQLKALNLELELPGQVRCRSAPITNACANVC